jgi:hypothetical protein
MPAKHESTLISMVTSLIHLRHIGEELGKKPFVGERMRPLMGNAAQAFDALQASFDAAEEALQKDAQPFIEAWLADKAFHIGSEVRFEGSHPQVAQIRGRLAGARLDSRLMYPAQRSIMLLLEDSEYAIGSGTSHRGFKPLNEYTADELGPVLSRVRGVTSGTPLAVDPTIRVILPIKQSDYDEMTTSRLAHFKRV